MKQYLDAVRHILAVGTRKENRTGVDTISTFNHNFEIDLRDGFPLLTTKEVSWKNIVVEMLWFLSGQTDIAILKRHGCKFWDAWADKETGKVPSAYGNFWRKFPVHPKPPTTKPTVAELEAILKAETSPGVMVLPNGEVVIREEHYNDQIQWAIGELNRSPMSRRLVVSAWAPGNAQTSKLPPCHCMFILNVQNEPCTAFKYVPRPGDPPSPLVRDESGKLVPPLINGEPFDITRQNFVEVPTTQQTKRLCLHLTQRSADIALGVPYNIASYGLLLHLFSRFVGIEPGIFAHTLVDAHAYCAKPDGSMAEYDHIPGLKEQLAREPRPLPKLHIDPSIKSIKDIERLMHPSVTTDEIMSLFVLEGYSPHPAIPFKVAV